jgi:hypothetical protein
MPELTQFSYVTGEFGKLLKEAGHGNLIKLCDVSHEEEIRPHVHGVMRIAETAKGKTVAINDGPFLAVRYADEYVPYYQGFVFRRGEQFHEATEPDQVLFTHPGSVQKCIPTPAGTFLIIDADGKTIVEVGKFLLGKSRRVRKQPYDDFHICMTGKQKHALVVRVGNSFFVGNAKKPFFTYKDAWSDRLDWLPYTWSDGIRIATSDSSDGAVKDQDGNLIFEDSHGPLSHVLPCNGAIVGRKDSQFFKNGNLLKERYVTERVIEHWYGPIIEREGTLFLVVIK